MYFFYGKHPRNGYSVMLLAIATAALTQAVEILIINPEQ
jgi:hypothetical protein